MYDLIGKPIKIIKLQKGKLGNNGFPSKAVGNI